MINLVYSFDTKVVRGSANTQDTVGIIIKVFTKEALPLSWRILVRSKVHFQQAIRKISEKADEEVKN